MSASTTTDFWARLILAGPVAVLSSLAIMAGLATWLPPGAGRVNHLVLPIVLFPAIFTALLVYSYYDRKLLRAYAVVVGLAVVHVALIALTVGRV